jgi:hypothetical protein
MAQSWLRALEPTCATKTKVYTSTTTTVEAAAIAHLKSAMGKSKTRKSPRIVKNTWSETLACSIDKVI